MRSMPVIVMQPGGQKESALPGIVVGTSVGPLAQSSLNESFGFAIGAGSEGFGEDVADVMGLAEAEEDARFIARAVVSEEAANADAETGKEGDRRL